MEKIERIIAEHPFFAGLKPEQIKTIAKNSISVTFNPGEFLMREDEPGNCFYLINQGRVALEVFTPERGPIILQTIGENEILGLFWLIPPYQCRFDVKAMELTRAICIDGQGLRDFCNSNPEAGFEILKRTTQILANSLEATRVQLLDIYGDHS